MVKFFIPRQRVFLFDAGDETYVLGGATALPKRPRIVGGAAPIVPIVGGASRLDVDNAGNKVYILVNSAGVPLRMGTPPRKRLYEASGPSGAATKAFYSWWRSHKTEPRASSPSRQLKTVPADVSARVRAFVASGAVSEQEADEFLSAMATVNREALNVTLLVRLALSGGPGTVRNYIVSYVLNSTPNKLEIQKRILLVAKARLISSTAPRPAGTLDLESFASSE